jgi:hypothetical protein
VTGRALSPNTKINFTLAGVFGILLAMIALWKQTIEWARDDADFRSEVRWRLRELEADKCQCSPWQSAPPHMER